MRHFSTWPCDVQHSLGGLHLELLHCVYDADLYNLALISIIIFITFRMVPELCWASCCVKLVRYCMYMWLPMYLYQAVSKSLLQQKAVWCSWTFYMSVFVRFVNL